MSIFHQLRKAANRVLSPAGLAIQRVEKQPWFHPAVVPVQVAGFSIEIPTLNPLSRLYQKNPDYTGHLGRVAALLRTKYANCAAIDIGANVGDTACIIRSGAAMPLLCVEGDDFTFGFLERNLRQFPNASAHKLFLGEKTQTVGVSLEKGGWNTTLIPDEGGAGQKIKLMSLDDFLAGRPEAANLKLLKVDTEGYDCAILRGARQTLRQSRPVISLEYNRDNMAALGEKGLDTLTMLADLGYAGMAVHDCDGRFFDAASLSDERFIRNLHDYADGKNAAVYYFDFTLFHEQDEDLSRAFTAAEQARRIV